MNRIILTILISSVLLTGCRIRDKVNNENEEIKNQTIVEDINNIESILNDLNHLETNSDDIADEDIISE